MAAKRRAAARSTKSAQTPDKANDSPVIDGATGKGKGKGKASASANNKSTKRKVSESVGGDDEEDFEADNNETLDDDGCKDAAADASGDDGEDVQSGYVEMLVDKIIQAAVHGEEFYGFEDDYDDMDTSHIPPSSEQRRKNGRHVGRDLIMWNRPFMDAKLIVIFAYECARHNIQPPWDAIAHRLHPGSSGSAILQHIARLRNTLFVNGHLVPPELPKAGGIRDPSHNTLRGFYRMPMNVRWSTEDPVFAAKRAITFKEKFEHNAHNLPDVHCLPFDPDTAFDDGILVDADNRIIRKNNKKVPKSKYKVGVPKNKKSTAKDTSSAAAFTAPAPRKTVAATGTKGTKGKKGKKAPVKKSPSSSPTTIPASIGPVDAMASDDDDDYNPSASKKSTVPRRRTNARAAKRAKTYHEVDPEAEPEADDSEPSEVLEVQQASFMDTSGNTDLNAHGADGDVAEEEEHDEVEDHGAANLDFPASPSSSTSPNEPDVLGLFSSQELQAPIDISDDEEDDGNGNAAGSSSSYAGSENGEHLSFGDMLAEPVNFDSHATEALELAQEMAQTQHQQPQAGLGLDLGLGLSQDQTLFAGDDYFSSYAQQNHDAMHALPIGYNYINGHNVDGAVSTSSTPPFDEQAASNGNGGMGAISHITLPPPILSASGLNVTLPNPFSGPQFTTGMDAAGLIGGVGVGSGGYTPPRDIFRPSVEGAGHYSRAVAAAALGRIDDQDQAQGQPQTQSYAPGRFHNVYHDGNGNYTFHPGQQNA